jgi:hypothetical protein
VAKVKIRFRAIVGDEYFAMLIGTHGTRVYIDIRVELLHGNAIASGFQQPAKRSGGYSFTQAGYNATGANTYLTDMIPSILPHLRQSPIPKTELFE